MLQKEGYMGSYYAGFPHDMRLSISRGLIPLAVFLLSFPLYATFISVYLIFALPYLIKRNIMADAKPLSPINRDCVHVPLSFVLQSPLSLERYSHSTSAFTNGKRVQAVEDWPPLYRHTTLRVILCNGNP